MIAPDANLLIYAHHPTSIRHIATRAWFEGILSAPEPVGIPILCIYAFLRFMTNPSVQTKPATFLHVSEIVDQWLALPHVRILYPGDRHWDWLRELGVDIRASGNVITDASIAAIALEYGATIYTNDRDFARFPGVRWTNPLRA